MRGGCKVLVEVDYNSVLGTLGLQLFLLNPISTDWTTALQRQKQKSPESIEEKCTYYVHFALSIWQSNPFKSCPNRTARIRHQCRKTTDLSCHRCLIHNGVEK